MINDYDLELDKVAEKIKKEKAKTVLLQFPDGLKPKATEVVDYLEEKCKGVTFLIWLGSCFGACDVPQVPEKDIDLIVQFGHSPWKFKDKDIKVVK
ncbi:MAG: diphthamide synthesis protein [archaeon]